MDIAAIEREVCLFVKEHTGKRSAVSPDDSLFGDLGIDGQDAAELMRAFSGKYRVDLSSFDFTSYFGAERGPGLYSVIILLRQLRGATPEEAAKLKPLKVSHLVDAAVQGRWASEGVMNDEPISNSLASSKLANVVIVC